jgi:Arc/MetJ family transcription regulator
VGTTIQLDSDVAAAVEQIRKRTTAGLSETINQLIRQSLRQPAARRPFAQRTARLGIKIDVANVSEALELLEGPAAR